MKRYVYHNFKLKVLLFLIFLVNISVLAQGFTVKNYSVDLTLHKEGYFDVTEKYDVDFTEPKHGILRDIITQYDFKDEEGKITKKQIKIKDLEVIGHKFSATPEIAQKFAGLLNIKIGDPNKLVTGPQTYEIKYRVYDALIFENDAAELYWNLKPSQWNTTFEKMDFNIHVPEGAELSAENCFTYAGDIGSEEASKQFDYQYNENSYQGISQPDWTSSMGQSVTILIKLPANLIVIESPGIITKKDYKWMGVLGGILAVFLLSWLKFGKDRSTISATSYYPPDGIDPAMAGYLINDQEDKNDLISLIPKWGAEGIISIEEIAKKGFWDSGDTKITRLGSLPENVPSYEKTMFEGLWNKGASLSIVNTILNEIKGFDFGDHATVVTQISGDNETVLMSSLRNSYYLTLNTASTQLENRAKAYYESSGEKAKILTYVIGIILLLTLTPYFFLKFGILAGISAFVSMVIILVLTRFMRKKNQSGSKTISELKGFRQFIKLAEINKIKMLLQEDPKYFEKTMSYALAFGMLNQWAKKFDGLAFEPPQWYHSSTISSTSGSFRMNHFAQSFTNSMSVASTAMVSSPSSRTGSGSHSSGGGFSGGGSSGGGFGGGGGGSW